MELQSIALKEKNQVMQAYRNDPEFIHTFFDYSFTESAFKQRAEELATRDYKRDELVSVIRSFMQPYGISEQADRHLQELSENAVAIVGGQQAGILTGPLYSVHKAISVILLAKEKRRTLGGLPVVPVFWIAGEDHDLNEINHTYSFNGEEPVKHQYNQNYVLKLTASDAAYDKEKMAGLVKQVFAGFGETEHTKSLLADVLEAARLEDTFTGFFARLMNGLFKEEGLLLIDSAYGPLRSLESDYFKRLISQSETIAKLVADQEDAFEQAGFSRPIGAERDAAHLFYIHDTGRILLSRQEDMFVHESSGFRQSVDDLLTTAQFEPQRLSNNVATRPIMQDLVFPVLGFVGGAGEIAYWALLKNAFHEVGIKMPVVVPRISMTLVTPQAQKSLDWASMTISDVLAGDVRMRYDNYVDTLRNEQFDSLLSETEKTIERCYAELKGTAGGSLQGLLDKNLGFHKRQIEFMRGKAEEEILLKNDKALRNYHLLEGELLPDGSLQERIYSPYAFMNIYGRTLVKDLLALPYQLEGKESAFHRHQLVYL